MKLIFISLLMLPLHLGAYSFDQYLKEAKEKDPSFRSAKEAQEGARLLADSAELLTGPQLFSQLSFLNDGRPTTNEAAQGNKTLNDSFSVGVKQQTLLGFSWSLSHNLSYTQIENASLIPQPKYYDSYPKLELSFSLWRNWLGAEVRSAQNELAGQLKMQELAQEIQLIQKENAIRRAYYELASEQKNVLIRKDSLARAERILTWAQSRLSRNLSDKSDVYQTQALVVMRKMELLTQEDKLKNAVRKFNSYVGRSLDAEVPELSFPEVALESIKMDGSVKKERLDLVLEKLKNEADRNSYLKQREKNKPNLDLSLIASRQGRGSSRSSADESLFEEQKDYSLVLLSFNMPLDMGTFKDSRQGYAQLAAAQEESFKGLVRDQSLDWQKMVDLGGLIVKQLEEMQKLESIQKQKADLERVKYNNGRSTTYQVLTFEQDYVNSRNQRINLELELRQYRDALRLYR